MENKETNAIFQLYNKLKKDKKTSLETFGGYIHTYKFDEDGYLKECIVKTSSEEYGITVNAYYFTWE